MDEIHITLEEQWRADDPVADAARNDGTHEVRADVAYKRILFVNHVYIGHEGAPDGAWALVDAGVTALCSAQIKAVVEERFDNARPSAIILTHGHFDHIGAARDLADDWECPIYVHEHELPYLNGSSAYPPADQALGSGMAAIASGAFPRGPFDLGERLQPLPRDGTVPGLFEWKWLHVPGHSPGMVVLWRERDRTLIAGDAFITTDLESAYSVLTQKPELHGPPRFLTADWEGARDSLRMVARLKPDVIIPGHGLAMAGPGMLSQLEYLAEHFDALCVPQKAQNTEQPC